MYASFFEKLLRSQAVMNSPKFLVLCNHIFYETPNLERIKGFVEEYPAAVREKYWENGAIPLHFAVAKGAPVDVVAYLIEQYPEGLKVPDSNFQLPIHHACSSNASLPVLKLLVEHPLGQGTLSAMRRYSALPLHCLVQGEPANLDQVQYIVEQFPESVQRADDNGLLPVHAACASRASMSVIQFLVRGYPKAIRLRGVDPYPWTPQECAQHPKDGRAPDQDVIAWLQGVTSGVIQIEQADPPQGLEGISILSSFSSVPTASTRIARQLEPLTMSDPNESLQGVALLPFRCLLSLDFLQSRQQLGEETFLIPPRDDVWVAIFVSHKWEEKPENISEEDHHPDPNGLQLHALQVFAKRILGLITASQGYESIPDLCQNGWAQAAYIAGSKKLRQKVNEIAPSGFEILYESLLDHCAIWYDYTCLFQKPRNDEQKASFKMVLQNLRSIVNGCTCVLSLRWDNDKYYQSGWCQWELCAGITADFTAGTCNFPSN